MKTRITPIHRSMPMSNLGPPSALPRFRWQQPIRSTGTPPNVGLTDEESRNGFHWGDDSVLPYGVYEDYDRAQNAKAMAQVVLDNGRLRVSIAPQFGGRLLELRDVALDRDLVFANPVFQPANLGALNAWFSGGVEWNGLIPGHTPNTVSPVFCGIVETERGSILRLYEFDRVVEAAWQIDLFLPTGDDRLFVHGRIINPSPVQKQAYWWTNIAVSAVPGLRVVSPADYGIEHVLPDNHLERLPFPDPARPEGSYPHNWAGATSVFFRKPDATRLYVAALDAEGVGLVQTATAAMRGRKFFYFGTAPGGQHWMNYLSQPGSGDYIEIQSGITPTQNQRFELPPLSELHWTEAFAALRVDPARAHASDYQIAEVAVGAEVDLRIAPAELDEIDAFMAAASQLPITTMLHEGSPWGGRHERLSGRRIGMGLDFGVSAARDVWDDIADQIRLRPEDLAAVPADFVTSDIWLSAIALHGSQHAPGALHRLALGIAQLDRGDRDGARNLFDQALALGANWLSFRQRALVTDAVDEAMMYYRAAWSQPSAPVELAVEIVQFSIQNGRDEDLAAFLSSLPEAFLGNERIILARAEIAARMGDIALLSKLLETRFATIREGESTLEFLWTELQRQQQTAALGRAPSSDEMRGALEGAPLPPHLDFRMLVPEPSAPR